MSEKMKYNLVPAAEKLVESMDDKKTKLVQHSRSVVVRGAYDHIEKVLDAVNAVQNNTISYDLITGERIVDFPIHPSQTLFVNCPGNIYAKELAKIRAFVESGGWLVTTDWALTNTVERGFPNTIGREPGRLPDDVVVIRQSKHGHPITKDVIEESQFWLEGGSYMIKVYDEHKVSPLIESEELKKNYGSELVMVGFSYGNGKVFHSLSHFELQRSKSGDTRLQDSYSSMMIVSNILAQKTLANLKAKKG